MSPFAEEILTHESYQLISGLIDSLPQKLETLHIEQKLEKKELLVLNQALALFRFQVDHQMSYKQRSLLAKARQRAQRKNVYK